MRLKNITKGPQSITEFMHSIKACTDHLALLGAPLQQEDITDRVLEWLDDTYQGVIEAVNARDTPISFAELHEKLINRELAIKNQPILGTLPATANPTLSRPANSSSQRQSVPNSSSHRANSYSSSPHRASSSFIGTRPFLGTCQWCHTKGHHFKNVLFFKKNTLLYTLPHLLLISPVHLKHMLLLLLLLLNQPSGYLTRGLLIMSPMISLILHCIIRIMVSMKL